MTAILEACRDLKLLAFDFDGTFTDGRVIVREDGLESVICSRKDSLGTNMLQQAGLALYVLSKETNRVVIARCRKMRIPCCYGLESGDDKRILLQRLMDSEAVKPEQVGYMGDDLNDIPALQLAGIAFCPSDAHPAVRRVCAYVADTPGGRGAVREVCELILRSKGVL